MQIVRAKPYFILVWIVLLLFCSSLYAIENIDCDYPASLNIKNNDISNEVSKNTFSKNRANVFLFGSEYKPYFELGGVKYFNQDSTVAGIYDLFIPLLQRNNGLFFTNLRIFDRSGSSFEGNTHLGFRKLFLDSKQMIGVYGAFDHRRSNIRNKFNQITVGLEYWNKDIFIGGNFYKPIGKTKKYIGEVKKEEISITSRSISWIETTDKYYEKALAGADAEFGYAFSENLTGYVGGYYFKSHDTDAITGPKANFVYNYNQRNGRILGFLDGVKIEVGAQHDRPRGTTAYIGIRFKMGLTGLEKSSNIFGFERHMVELIRRDPDVVTKNPPPETETKKEIYDFAEVMQDVSDAIHGSNDNLNRNRDAYNAGLEAARKALEQKKKINEYAQTNPQLKQLLSEYQETAKSMLDEVVYGVRTGQQKTEEFIGESKELVKRFFERNPTELKDWLEKIKNSNLPEKIRESANQFLSSIGSSMHNVDPKLAVDIVFGAVGTGAASYFLCELVMASGGFIVGPAGTISALVAGHPFCTAFSAVGAATGGLDAGLDNMHFMSSGSAGGGKGKVWTSTKKYSSVENAFYHWEKHGLEFPKFKNAKQYVEGIRNFFSSSPKGTLTKIRTNGDVIKYHPKSNTFAIADKTGTPRTMYKPDPLKHGYKTNLEYFYAQ